MKYILIILLLISGSSGYSQIPTSLSVSPYAGIDRIHLNPALGIKSIYGWDVTLAGAHLFASNDYTFLRTANLLNLNGRLSDAGLIVARGDIPESSNRPLVIFDEDEGSKSLYLNGRINGPSFSIDLGSNTRVGLFSNIRIHASSSDIPENFGVFELNQSFQTNIIEIERGSASFASWMEIGAHVSKNIDNISFGANFKLLRGNEGGLVNSNVEAAYDFVDSIITVTGVPDFELAFTNASINASSFQTDINGSGIGLDFGVVYQTELLQLGASVADIGVIRYKSNVEIYTPDILSTITEVRTQDFRNFTSLRNLIDQFQIDQNITPDLFGVFSIGLPTRLSLFGDYQYNNDISISAVINQRLPLFPNSLKATNSLVITPRYETSLWSFYLPVTILEYSSLRVGSAFRVGPLTIGSDHLSSILFNSDFSGSDIFFNLKIYPFRSYNRKGGRRGGDVICPEF